jgi:Virus neck protein.
MAVNTHFHSSNIAAIQSEKNLYADLVAEAIQIHGHDVHYLDRTLTAEDTIFGEDSLAKFTTQAKIEMYVENSEGGFAGEKELMSQFGLQNLSEITFVVSKTRFQDLTKQVTIESGTDTLSGSILLESGTIPNFEGGYMISEATSTDSDRPLEGDLVYHPILDKVFQINFVDHDEPFYQLDNNPVFKLNCRLFDYSSEIIDTDVAAIDAIETEHTLSTTEFNISLEQTAAYNENIR